MRTVKHTSRFASLETARAAEIEVLEFRKWDGWSDIARVGRKSGSAFRLSPTSDILSGERLRRNRVPGGTFELRTHRRAATTGYDSPG
jgi:hypothetical protein